MKNHKQKSAKWDQSFLNLYLNQKKNSAASKFIQTVKGKNNFW